MHQRRPYEQRHPHQVHARAAHLVDGDGEIDPRQRRSDGAQRHRPDPVVGPHARAEGDFCIWRVPAPAARRKLADDERRHHQPGRPAGQPQADRVEQREGDVPAADLEGHDIINEADEEWHRHEEDHDAPMRAEQLGEMVGRKEAGIAHRRRLLHPHQYRLDQRPAEHHEGQHDVHDADFLVIEAGEPFGPEVTPLAEPRDQRHDHDSADDDDQSGARADDLACGGILPCTHEWQLMPAEAAEDRGPDALGHRRASWDWARMRWNRPCGIDEKRIGWGGDDCLKSAA